MNISFKRSVVFAVIFVMSALGSNLALAQTAPIGDQAYPPFGSCTSANIPSLPQQWSANALLTPFQSQPLQVARVSAISGPGTESRMVITTDDVASIGPKAWYIKGDKTYELSDGPNGFLQCNLTSNIPTQWKAPSAEWLANSDCDCMGSNSVTGKDAEAWRCSNGMDQGNGPEYDWYWFTKDQNRYPHRIINSRENNTQSLPVLGDASLVNFTDISTTPDALLGIAETVCGDAVTEVVASLQSPAIAGLTYDPANAPPPPTWPNTAFANGALFAVDGSYTGMAIYYDWNSMQEVSKIKSSIDGSIQDTRLTKGITYEMYYPQGPTAAPVCDGTLVNVGTWHPTWASDDGCKYMATIDTGSPLNPIGTPLQAMACYFGGTGPQASNIQAWYSFAQEPVMFYETNAKDLDLIDYYKWIPNATIPSGVLYPINSCPGTKPQVLTECNACHGKN